MAKFDILVNNGFNYEIEATIESKSWKTARQWFEKFYEGSYKLKDFKVRKIVN